MSSTYLRSRRRYSSRTVSGDDILECDYSIKAILLGDIGVGKTTFFRTFMDCDINSGATAVPNRRGQGQSQASGGASPAHGHKVITFQEKRVKLTIWDTAGQERYRSLTASYYRGAQASIIMYDVNNMDSFDNVINWLESTKDFLDESSGGAVTLLVGINNEQVNPAHNHEAADGIPTTTAATMRRVPSTAVVSLYRAENLASHYHVPHLRLDNPHSPAGVAAVVDRVLSLVMTRATANATLSHTIRPYSVRLAELAKKRSHCSSCCSA